MSFEVRPVEPGDLPQITDIYAHHVLEGTASFEEVPPNLSEMISRWHALTSANLPYFVAVRDDRVIGYTYAGMFRTRSAYRFTLENSVYVAPGHKGQSVGKTLLTRLIGRSGELGFRQMIAVIGGNNAASIALHRGCGFETAGTLRQVGFKLDQWVDIVMMQRDLGQ